MRSPLRIPGFLHAVQVAWSEQPDMRFGQLLMNISRDPDGTFPDTWNWENSAWLERIDAFIEENRDPPTGTFPPQCRTLAPGPALDPGVYGRAGWASDEDRLR